ncbi:hypothetical protein OG800_08850 [Streptomyces sp. NBC_00445]|uniref:hypothetical protein n=1 Tax=Streptomyces sp. NBC_00445 TaxID=2975745 RepID=UPI002E1CCB32
MIAHERDSGELAGRQAALAAAMSVSLGALGARVRLCTSAVHALGSDGFRPGPSAWTWRSLINV